MATTATSSAPPPSRPQRSGLRQAPRGPLDSCHAAAAPDPRAAALGGGGPRLLRHEEQHTGPSRRADRRSGRPRARGGRGPGVFRAHGSLDRGSRLDLVAVGRVAAPQVRERHPQGVVLHLPDVAQLVADEVVAVACGRAAEQDRVPGRVAVEAAKPRQAEEPGKTTTRTRRSDRERGRARAGRGGLWRDAGPRPARRRPASGGYGQRPGRGESRSRACQSSLTGEKTSTRTAPSGPAVTLNAGPGRRSPRCRRARTPSSRRRSGT